MSSWFDNNDASWIELKFLREVILEKNAQICRTKDLGTILGFIGACSYPMTLPSYTLWHYQREITQLESSK